MIRISQLTKHYRDNPVLRGIDLEVSAGEFVVVLGQSGAGKSTLLRCINRLVQADSGTLNVAGIDALTCSDTRALRRQADPAIDDLAARAQDLAARSIDYCAETSARARRQMQQAAEATSKYVAEQPGKSLVIAAASGALLATVAMWISRRRDAY